MNKNFSSNVNAAEARLHGDNTGNLTTIEAMSKKLLLIGDPAAWPDFTACLSAADYQLHTVAQLPEALRVIREHSPRIIFLDGELSEAANVPILQAIRKDGASATTPVIVLAADAEQLSHIEVLQSAADDFLVRPFSAPELLARIGRALALAAIGRQTQERVNLALENISDGLITLDRQWRYTYVNTEAECLLGRGRGQLLGKSVWEEIPHLPQSELEPVLRRAANEQLATDFESYHPTQQRWYENKVYPLPDGGISIFFRDISERKRAQEALRQSEERLRLATQTGKVGIWDWNILTNQISWSDSLYAIHGVTSDEFDATVEGFAALVHPQDRERVSQAIEAALKDGAPYELEFRALRPDNEVVWLFTSARVLREGGRASRMLGATLDLTQHKRAEAALRESEERFAKAFSASPISLTISSLKDSRLIEVNDTFVEVSGFSREEALGRTTAELGLWAQPADREAELAMLQQSGQVRNLEYRFRVRNGEEVIGLLSAEKIDIGGEPFALTVIQDITERKRAERANTLLAAIVESSDDAIISKDLNGMIMSWNRGAQNLLGYIEAEAVGSEITLIIPPEKYEEEREIFRRLRRGEHIAHYETLRLTKDGRKVDVSLTLSPIRDNQGQIVGASSVARDITERKRIETTLRKQSERQRLMWEAASILLTTSEPDKMMREIFYKLAPHFDLDTYFNFMVNEAGDALQLQSCVGIPDETAESIRRLEFGQAVCGTVAVCRTPIVATFIQDSDDEMTQLVKTFGIRAYACSPLIADGKLLGTLSFASRTRNQFDDDEVEFLRTISHYVTVAYERLGLVRELKENDRRKDEFLATLAHELRNPLAPIRNGLQIMRLAPDNREAVEQAHAMMERQLQQMVRLIDDLLDLSRISQGKIELRKERVNLAEVVQTALEISRPLLEQYGHHLNLELPDEPIYVEADVTRLAQVFANLLNNAAKYTEKDGQIHFQARQQGNEILIRVKDNGIGIPVFMLSKVFEMFTQVHPLPDRTKDGLGIGLSIAKRLVEMHGGQITAHSAGYGTGSEFVIRFPALMSASAAQNVSEEQTEPAPAIARRRILVADDNLDSADSMAILLGIMGNDVRTAHDGLVAVKETMVFHPDVILLDIGMPEMNGYDACRRIRELPEGKDAVIIALTGWGQDEDRRQSQEAGFDYHLVKPVDLGALEKLLESLDRNPA